VTLAVVPVKRLADTKSRLFPGGVSGLSPSASERGAAHPGTDAREALTLAMLRDVVGALDAAESVQRTVVLTPDEAVAAVARDAGAEALVRNDPGLNAAIDLGARRLAPGDEPLLVVLGDVAGALPSDIDALSHSLLELGGRGVVLAPSSDGGTAALLRAPFEIAPSRFGPDSAKLHREACAQRGAPYKELPLPSLAIDLDLPEDVERFLETSQGGRETRRVLRELGLGAGSDADSGSKDGAAADNLDGGPA
jgi:2-phospho-L-lactate guanylyltransferase